MDKYVLDLASIGPELVLCGTVLVLLLVDLWRLGRERSAVWVVAPFVTVGLCACLMAGARASGMDLMPEFAGIVGAYAIVTLGDIVSGGAKRGSDDWVPGTIVLLGACIAGYRLYGQAVGHFAGDETWTGDRWGGLVGVDSFAIFFRGLALVSLFVSTWFTIFYRPMNVGQGKRGVAEFLACLVGAHIGAMFLVSTSQLVFIFLSLEMLSLCSYMQAGMLKGDRRSAEASLKYVIYGSMASGLMLFGFSILYAFSGSLTLEGVARAIGQTARHAAGGGILPEGVLMTLGLLATLGGFAYKLSIVPFHFWAPDVYEGSPTPTTAFLAVGSKAAAFAILLRFMASLAGDVAWVGSLTALLAIGSAITMTYGNLAALRQSNLKRLFAYSSIAHAGYMLMGVVALFTISRDSTGAVVSTAYFAPGCESIVFYLLAYLLMTLGAFGVVIYFANRTRSEEIDDIRGLGWRSPIVGSALVVFLLSLTGIPPTAGFFGKWYLFRAVLDTGYAWLAVVAILNTVVSLFYYFRIAKALFLSTADEALFPAPRCVMLAGCLVLLAGLTVWFGVFPGEATGLVQAAAAGLR